MILFLLLLMAAVALGIVGILVHGIFYLLIIGAVLLVLDLLYLGGWLSRRRRRPTR